MRRFILFALVLGLGQFMNAQSDYPEPDFDDKPMYFNPETKALEKLERQTANAKVKNKFVKVETHYYFEGSASDKRFPKNKAIQFIYRPASPKKEIELQLFLYKYEIDEKKNQRILKTASASVAGGKSINSNLPFDYKKVNEGTYLISVEELDKGEYGFATTSTTYLFGIDD